MEWYWVVGYVLVIWIAVFITPVGLPGPLLIAAAALAGWWSGWTATPLWIVIVFAILGLSSEAVEHWLTVAGARSYGSSKAGLWGSFLGGLVGAFMGFPVPVIGSLIGAFVGAFVGAVLFEMLVSRKGSRDAFRAGYGAFRGRFGAILLKTVLALAMASGATLLLVASRA
jgi:uncharacterized protein